MRYLLCLILPPVAVATVAGPLAIILNFLLWMCFVVPGVIHAILMVDRRYAETRHREIVGLHRRSIAAQNGGELSVGRQPGWMRWLLVPFAVLGIFVAVMTLGIIWSTTRDGSQAAVTEKAPSPTPKEPTSVKFTAPAPVDVIIPGIAPVDVYLNLEEKGFETKKHFGREQSDFICEWTDGVMQYTATIYIPASNIQSVKVVTAMALNIGGDQSVTDARAAEFLGYVATLKYAGAQPDQARAWVEENTGRNATTTIGSAQLQMFANTPRARVLRISPAPIAVGATYQSAVSSFGQPSSADKATGWAVWPGFKARFQAGKCVEVGTP